MNSKHASNRGMSEINFKANFVRLVGFEIGFESWAF